MPMTLWKKDKTMKNLIAIVLFSLLFVPACRQGNKQAELGRLEAQREALDKKIERLRADLARDNGPAAEEPLAYVRGIAVRPSLFRHFIQVQGTVESDNNILIPAQANGLVKRLYVHQGDRVTEGQLLAELDGAILESSLAELQNSLTLASTIYERQARLWEKNIGSELEYLQAKNNRENLEKRLKTLQEQYRLTKITSPIDGMVDDVLIKEGEMAAAGRGAVRIVQLSKLKIKSALSENYISRIKRGDPVEVAIPVADRTLDLTIDAVSQVIDPNNRTFNIEIRLPSREKGLKPNMLAVVTINDYTNPQALTVPQNVVQETGESQFLFVAQEENGRRIARRRTVTPGEAYDNRLEVLGGLTAEEIVVTFGFQNLADGQPVSVQRED
jgi:membrane fusion protein (multidrug efflux system)